MFFLSSIFTQNILSLEYFGGDSLYVKSVTAESTIGGFQFELSNMAITNVNMPDSISDGFNISYDATTILGFSFSAAIPGGTNILSIVHFDTLSVNGNICFDDECFQNDNGLYNCFISNSSGGGLPLENYNTGLDYCAEGCFDGSACNSWTTDSCEYPDANYNCDDSCGGINNVVDDECGVCDGDNSTCADCTGIPNGSAYEDECGICGGDNSTCADCNGTPNGTNWDSACGCVTADNSGDDCDDCFGIPNGTALDDECGVCGGDDSACTDCNDEINGDASIDGCGVCVGGNTGEVACSQDCLGIEAGSAYYDACDVCVDLGDTSCVEGCDGNYANDESHLVDDECGICAGDNSTCSDCANVPNGNSFTDNCNECVAAGDTSCVEGCDGNFANDGSHAVDDECNQCGGDNTTCTDCYDDINGSAYMDGCGDCVGGDTGVEPCSQDCLGVDGGSAFFDNCDLWAYLDGCEECVGGSTGVEACPIDCAGVDYGTSYYDNCGVCVPAGDTTCVEGCDGNYANDGSHVVKDECEVCDGDNSTCVDCAGIPNGATPVDECGECDGDNSTCSDCAGTPNGSNWVSNCGCVAVDNSGDDCDDCLGIPDGPTLVDECGE